MSLPLQDVLEGKYEILDKIGEGGIGAVYKVRHRLLDEVRVIKVLRPQAAAKEDLRERFLQEARMAIRLKHPNIAQLHDFSIAEDDRAYIVMEFIDGVGLDSLLAASGPPSVELTLELSRQALAALDYLHQNDFVHRDVSPDNLMLTTAFDGSPLVKLIDLGIAKHLGGEAGLTATGVFLGKARYCSPEQFSAGGETEVAVDRRADIYSYGVMLYELLTGSHPLRGESFAELAGSHLFQPPRPFEETDPEGRVPEGLRQAVLKALAKVAADRFATAAEFADELARFRDPDHSFREEFNHTVELTTSSMPRHKEYNRPGSTQGRLDRQFGLGKTQSPATAAALADLGKTAVAGPASSVELAAGKVEKLLARGRRRPAARALARAIAEHGEAAQLVELRQRLEAAAETSPPRRSLPALLAAVGVLAVAAVGLAVWRGWLGQDGKQALADQQLAEPLGGQLDEQFAGQFDGQVDGQVEPQLDGQEAPGEPQPAAAAGATAGAAVVFAVTPRWDPSAVDGSPDDPINWPEAPPAPAAAEAAAGQPAGAVPAAARPPATAPGASPPPAPQARPAATPPAEPQYIVSQETYQPGVGVVPPVLVEVPKAVAPTGGRRLRDELLIVVEVLVDETGKVLTARAADAPAFRGKYRDAAIEAASAARFQPARRGNTLGRMWAEVHITFPPD